jgi:serine/threonine-protein kinase RsbW
MSNPVFRITSCPSQIAKLEEYVREVSEAFNIHETKFPDILISLTEAVNNAIIHGNCSDTTKCVDIESHSLDNKVVFTIRDQGKGFDPNAVKDPTLQENLLVDGGRGVFIMKQLCDTINYKNNGSTVEIAFNLQGA